MRAPTREEALAMLDELYAQLPAIDCKGRCHDTCTAIDASELERERMAERGVHLPRKLAHVRLLELIEFGETPRCPALGPLNNCTVYDVRPFTCRAFGAVLDKRLHRVGSHAGPMMCDHGCVPEGVIDIEQFKEVLRQIEELSFAVTGVRRLPR